MPIRADTSARSNPNLCLTGEKTDDLTKGSLLEQNGHTQRDLSDW